MMERLRQLADRLSGYNPVEVFIEMALIWIVVYLIWRFLRGTRGARVLKGFAVVVIVAGGIITLLGPGEFPQLRFLLEWFLIGASIALVIVFQPELRRALMRIGEAKLFRGHHMDMEPVIEQIIGAVKDMSKNKIGAIIAIEREVGLGGIYEAGTLLNANVSTPLLKTIFWPGTALHDMGVVVNADKIVAAGVQFPLAESDSIGQELGSRHRAAIGLSQESDCLVIVVSEETGAISLAERGQLLRKLSVDGLRAMLRRGLGQTTPPQAEGGKADGEGADRSGGKRGGASPDDDTEDDQDSRSHSGAEKAA
ncbi:MAG: TIGR00159 family protein [Phycisphaera sp.]|nr:TIGR00159 family protein [Phycisphaera sp.]